MGNKTGFQQLSTAALEEILRTEQYDERAVTVEEILQICEILVRRRGGSSWAKEAWERFVEYYMPE